MSNATTIPELMREMGQSARAAYRLLAAAEDEQKNTALLAAAESIRRAAPLILAENAKDMQAARTKGLDAAMLDRLLLNNARIEAMAAGLESIAELPDPVGEILAGWQRPNGLKIARVSVPLGVIGIIYESRPNVTADAGGLCLKSGNACILRGGSESLHSSMAIAACLHEGLRHAGLPETCIQLVPTTDRDAVGALLRMTDLIDVIIPRGGKSLTERVQQESRVPTLLHLDGNCHTYIHQDADPEKAIAVTLNAKMRRTGVCGATESLLIDRAIAPSLLPKLAAALQAKNCTLRGDDEARALVPTMEKALERDWGTEYLDAVLSVKIVGDVQEAIRHINEYGSHHTDAIITENNDAAQIFCAEVDSAIVMHNASTQFADGGEFGMGAEIGIATGRLHARGPVGADQLVTYKYIVVGDGQVRA